MTVSTSTTHRDLAALAATGALARIRGWAASARTRVTSAIISR